MPTFRILRALLAFIALYHLSLGVLAIVSDGAFVQLARALGGATAETSPQAVALMHAFGAYLAAFGVAMAVAAWDPVKYRALVSIAVVLFALRVAQRALTIDESVAAYGITALRAWVNLGIVGAIGAVLLVYRIKLGRAASA